MELKVGEKYTGKVTGIKPFGAFVQLENGKSGLVHISELSNKFISSTEEVVEMGQVVEVRVKEIGDNGKLNFSMKDPDERRRPPSNRAMDLDKAITNFLKDSDEKQTMLGRPSKGRTNRRG